MESELIPLVAARFKALADPRRLALLSALQGGERTVTELAETTQRLQPNVSQHLARLARAGLVGGRIRANTFLGGTDSAIRLEARGSYEVDLGIDVVANEISGGSRGIVLGAHGDDSTRSSLQTSFIASNWIYVEAAVFAKIFDRLADPGETSLYVAALPAKSTFRDDQPLLWACDQHSKN